MTGGVSVFSRHNQLQAVATQSVTLERKCVNQPLRYLDYDNSYLRLYSPHDFTPSVVVKKRIVSPLFSADQPLAKPNFTMRHVDGTHLGAGWPQDVSDAAAVAQAVVEGGNDAHHQGVAGTLSHRVVAGIPIVRSCGESLLRARLLSAVRRLAETFQVVWVSVGHCKQISAEIWTVVIE